MVSRDVLSIFTPKLVCTVISLGGAGVVGGVAVLRVPPVESPRTKGARRGGDGVVTRAGGQEHRGIGHVA